MPLVRSKIFEPRELYEKMKSGDAPIVVDVRQPIELAAARIGTPVNLPLTDLSRSASKLDPSQPVVTICRTSYRSSMAMGILERAGFENVATILGGSQAWIDAGLPTRQSARDSVSLVAGQQLVDLPERISADELRRLQMDLPGTFDLVDIRPAEHFADYHIPGSRNAAISDVLSNAAYLNGAGPLIIADRDGSLAMMVAGMLSQKTDRQIKALYGGVELYWRTADIGSVGRLPVPLSSGGGGDPGLLKKPAESSAQPGLRGAPQPSKPQKPKARSAGC
jgi:rhodanese-related sulfurtransferase